MKQNQIVIFIIGLPASGKSFLAKKLASQTNALVIDDPKFAIDIRVVINCNPYRDFIICDPNLCQTEIRKVANFVIKNLLPFSNTKYIFFENNPAQCLINAKLRSEYYNDNREVTSSIKILSKAYEIPEDYEALPVWKPET